MQVKNEQSELDMGQLNGSKLEDQYHNATYCHPVYLIYMQNVSCEMPGWINHRKPIKRKPSCREKYQQLQICTDTTLMVESKEELKSLMTRVKEESEKSDLKLNIQKTKIMASGPITLWQIDGAKMETVTDFIFLGSKITVDGDCRHEIKRCFLLGRKAMTNLDSVLKNRDITLLTQVHIVKTMVFLVVYGCETLKKAEH